MTNQAGCWWLKPIIIATWEAEIRRIQFEVSLYKNFTRPFLNQQLGVMVDICHPKLHRRLRSEGLWFQVSPRKEVCKTPSQL
jgi:hypothetical protein